MFNSVQGGYIGNIAGNPFGSDFVVPQQRKPVPGGPQMAPLKQPPARVFPPDQPGREGAIDVRLAMGMPGMNNEETTRRQEPSYPMLGPGSMGMIGANIEEATRRNEPSFPMFGPGSMGMIGGNIGNVGSMTSTLRGNPYGNSTQIMSNTQQAKEAGFNRKTVS
jgi:hypothetical protein